MHYRFALSILLVVTEHSDFLSATRRGAYERIRQRLEDIAGAAVRSTHYAEVGRLEGFDGVVLSGSSAPWSAHEDAVLGRLGEAIRAFDGPVLGICAGMQLQAMFAGGSVGRAQRKIDTGFAPVEVVDDGDLLRGLPREITVYHRHTDEITSLPDGFGVVARSPVCDVEAIANPDWGWWGTQFHPEEFSPEHPDGERVLRNFFESVK